MAVKRAGVRITGLREVLRAFDQLPGQARAEVRAKSDELAKDLASLARAAASARGRQAGIAGTTVKAETGGTAPAITAGRTGSPKARALVLGTEFGATRRFGWYGARRYYNLPNKQFPPHRGSDSYWFFKTVDQNNAHIERSYLAALDEIARRWAN